MISVTSAQLQAQGAVLESKPGERIQRWRKTTAGGEDTSYIFDSQNNKAVKVEDAGGAAMVAMASAALVVDLIQASVMVNKAAKIAVMTDALECL